MPRPSERQKKWNLKPNEAEHNKTEYLSLEAQSHETYHAKVWMIV